jgi:hypothetical protein
MPLPNWLKGFAGDLLADFFSLGLMKNIFTKVVVQKAISKDGEKKADGKSEESEKTPDIKHGGIFDLSDEIAYGEVLTKLQIDPRCADKNYHQVVSRFLNTLPHDWQRRHFRVVVGSLVKVEYTKGWEKIPRGGTDKRLKEVAMKTNLGVEFLKSFASLGSDKERKEICQAAGILSSPQDTVEKEVKKKVREATKAIGEFNNVVAGPPHRGFWTELTGGKAK